MPNFQAIKNNYQEVQSSNKILRYLGILNEPTSKNRGAAIFDYIEGNIQQRFALNLRYYKSSGIEQRRDGVYEFTADPQKSF